MSDIREFILLIRRRWHIVAWCVTICLSAAFAIAYTGPVLYRSTGTIIIEQPDIPEDLARSTVGGALEQRLELIRRRVMVDETLKPIVEKYNLFPELEPRQRPEALSKAIELEQINPVTLEAQLGGAAFSVSFDYSVPEITRDVAMEIVNLFLEDNRRARTESAADTERFFAAQGERLAGRVADLEQQLSIFKQNNQGLLPEDVRRNQQILERLERELTVIQGEIRLSTERRNLLIVQRDELAGGTELAMMKNELSAARQIYTDDHPTIRRLLRNIEAIEAADRDPSLQDSELRRTQTQLTAVEAEIAADRRQEQLLKSRIADLQDNIVLAPEVEKKLQELTRDYELAVGEYREIRQKRSDAEIAQSLEDEDKGERYTLLRRPGIPASPFSPNRVGIMLIGIMLAIAGSAALVAVREGVDASVRSSRDVLDAFDGPPIATIPVIRNSADSRRHWQQLMTHAAGLLLTVALAIGIVINE